MGLFDGISKLFGGQKSGAVAKERLQLVLIHDRNDISPEVLTALRAVEGSPKGLGTGAIIGIVAACVVVAAGAVTAGVLIGKKKKAKKDGE